MHPALDDVIRSKGHCLSVILGQRGLGAIRFVSTSCAAFANLRGLMLNWTRLPGENSQLACEEHLRSIGSVEATR